MVNGTLECVSKMKKLLGIVVLSLLLSGNAYANLTLVCGLNKIKVDKKYIYEYFGSGAVHEIPLIFFDFILQD
jgi:hypothetical protein